MEIRIDGKPLDLAPDFSLGVEESSPIFNDRGSMTLPVSVPSTAANRRAFHFAHRPDSAMSLGEANIRCTVADGFFMRSGIVNLTEASADEGYSFNIGIDNSVAYAKWAEKTLSQLSNLPVWRPTNAQGDEVQAVLALMNRLYRAAVPAVDDLAVFPVAVSRHESGDVSFWEILNKPLQGMVQPTTIQRYIGNERRQVNVPNEAYAVTPFLRVWRLLELVFADLGLSIAGTNPFRADSDLARLVVLNNTADTLCTGCINYRDLVPDCTVEEFLNALWVRFGLVYLVNYDNGTVSLRLLDDILKQPATLTLDPYLTAMPKLTMDTPQYVVLSAGTSLDGAAPPCERFEDFANGVDLSDIREGSDVKSWKYNRETDSWDGDVRDDFWEPDNPGDDYPEQDFPEFEAPDPDDYDPRDEYDDYDDRDYSRAAPAMRSATPSSPGSTLSREFVTGVWHRLDTTNGNAASSGSGFFSWNPATPGLNAFSLASADECVPVGRASDSPNFSGMCPLFLTGARHRHSYVVNADKEEEITTPLAFMLAYTSGQTTVGRLSPERENGAVIVPDDGSVPTLTLYFQFADGLFARYWARFDKFLRHANTRAEIHAHIPKRLIYNFDMARPVMLCGVPCLPDTIGYSLPSAKDVDADMEVRIMSPHGCFDISAEQNVPDFAVASRKLIWVLVETELSPNLPDKKDNRNAAASKFIAASGYKPHGSEGDSYLVDFRSAVPIGFRPYGASWQTDSTLSGPANAGETRTRSYRAEIIYDIYEIHDLTPEQGATPDWERDEIPLGRVSVIVPYSVRLVAKLVPL